VNGDRVPEWSDGAPPPDSDPVGPPPEPPVEAAPAAAPTGDPNQVIITPKQAPDWAVLPGPDQSPLLERPAVWPDQTPAPDDSLTRQPTGPAVVDPAVAPLTPVEPPPTPSVEAQAVVDPAPAVEAQPVVDPAAASSAEAEPAAESPGPPPAETQLSAESSVAPAVEAQSVVEPPAPPAVEDQTVVPAPEASAQAAEPAAGAVTELAEAAGADSPDASVSPPAPAAFAAARRGQPGPSSAPERQIGPKPRHRGRLVAAVVGLVVLLAVGGGAFWASRHFVDRAKPGVTVALVEVTGQDGAELRRTVERIGAELRLPLALGQERAEATAFDLGLTVDVDRTVAQALAGAAGRPFWSAYNPFLDKPSPLFFSLDRDQLQSYLNQRFVDPGQITVDASVAFDPESGRFQTQASKVGVGVDAGPVVEALQAWADGRAGLGQVKLSTALEQPRIDDLAAQAAAETANSRIGLEIVVEGGSGDQRRTYQVQAAEVAAWTVLTPDLESGQIVVSYDQAEVARQATDQINQLIGQPAVNEYTVLHPVTGARMGVSQRGQTGLVVTDVGPGLAAVQEALASGQSRTATVPTETVPYGQESGPPPSHYDQPNGAKWIDVNLSNHYVTLYEGTTEIARYLVTTGAPGTATRTGVNYISSKLRAQTMTGSEADPYTVDTEWVAYFDGGIAFHSAPWREPRQWGMNLSHGCVNMKTVHAKFLWEWAPLGTKVDVHY
jgi:lipoprotein-anchoring transpeptidase ErfK/SrfK